MSRFEEVVASTDPDELQFRNGQKHQRGYNPDLVVLLEEILCQSKLTNLYLSQMLGETFNSKDVEE